MITGVGTDILKIDRLRNDQASLTTGSPFLTKTFTTDELHAAAERADPTRYLATRFAGKEAVFKALGTGDGLIRLNEIEILNDDNGQPNVTLSGRARLAADAMSVTNIQISLSHDTDYAIAFAIMQNQE